MYLKSFFLDRLQLFAVYSGTIRAAYIATRWSILVVLEKQQQSLDLVIWEVNGGQSLS